MLMYPVVIKLVQVGYDQSVTNRHTAAVVYAVCNIARGVSTLHVYTYKTTAVVNYTTHHLLHCVQLVGQVVS